jgi:hypothetical protein
VFLCDERYKYVCDILRVHGRCVRSSITRNGFEVRDAVLRLILSTKRSEDVQGSESALIYRQA